MFTIRPITTLEECAIADTLAQKTWQDAKAGISPDLLLTIIKNKGIALMVYDGDTPIGYCFSFPSFTTSKDKVRLKHCSHHAAILPAYQGLGLGAQLKWAQRKQALAQGVDHMTWTFDPLETRNAHLNINKLGAVCNTFLENCYGVMTDALNKGLPSDRFQVDWWLSSERVTACSQGHRPPAPPSGPSVNAPALGADLFQPKPLHDISSISWEAPALQLHIPKNFQALKQADTQLALAWRLYTREVFQEAFKHHFSARALAVYDDYCSYYLVQEGGHG